MGDFLDSINDRAKAPASLAHRVALFLATQDRRAIIVEAGDDQYFYSALLRRINHRRQVDLFVAYGKSKVGATLDVLADLKKIDRAFGIVDRDFEFDLPERTHGGSCLVLDVYSYENYVCSKETLLDLGVATLGLEGGSPEVKRWEDCVDQFLESSGSALRREHAEALWCRRNEKTCHLNNFDPLSAMDIGSSGTIQRRADTNSIFVAQTAADIGDLSDEVRDALCYEISGRAPATCVRGHFLTRMLVRVLNLFRSIVDAEFASQGRPRTRTRVELSERHAVEAAISFVVTPPLVDKFLREVVA